jgi:hypothetical protein
MLHKQPRTLATLAENATTPSTTSNHTDSRSKPGRPQCANSLVFRVFSISPSHTLGRPRRAYRMTLLFTSNASLIVCLRQINHHLETIAQLRQEAVQWKNQCLRLEETSRQEATSWKEQFLRVEQERSKLAQRVEELVAEQLGSVCSFNSTCMVGSLSTCLGPNIGYTVYSRGKVFRHGQLVHVHPISACPRARYLDPAPPRIPSLDIWTFCVQDNLKRKSNPPWTYLATPNPFIGEPTQCTPTSHTRNRPPCHPARTDIKRHASGAHPSRPGRRRDPRKRRKR